MREPLFWNPINDCAIWLSELTGQSVDARTVVDRVAKMGIQGDPAPTIIGLPIPHERGVIRVMMPGHPDWNTPQTELQRIHIQVIENKFGPPPCGEVFKYIEQIYPTFAFLCISDLMRLLIYGRSDIATIRQNHQNEHELLLVTPWDGGQPATIDTCGIKRDDLIALGEKLLAQTAPTTEKETNSPAPVSRTMAQDIAILAALREGGHDPLALMQPAAGMPGVKKSVRQKLTSERKDVFTSVKVFNNAWQRLRDDGSIKDKE